MCVPASFGWLFGWGLGPLAMLASAEGAVHFDLRFLGPWLDLLWLLNSEESLDVRGHGVLDVWRPGLLLLTPANEH